MNSYHDPSRIAEDHHLRSNHIRELIHEAVLIETSPNRTEIPKVLVQFWHDRADVPEDVRNCLDSWEPLKKQGFDRVLFDDTEARYFISRRVGRAYLRAF